MGTGATAVVKTCLLYTKLVIATFMIMHSRSSEQSQYISMKTRVMLATLDTTELTGIALLLEGNVAQQGFFFIANFFTDMAALSC